MVLSAFMFRNFLGRGDVAGNTVQNLVKKIQLAVVISVGGYAQRIVVLEKGWDCVCGEYIRAKCILGQFTFL